MAILPPSSQQFPPKPQASPGFPWQHPGQKGLLKGSLEGDGFNPAAWRLRCWGEWSQLSDTWGAGTASACIPGGV